MNCTEAFDITLLSGYVIVFVRSWPLTRGKSVTVKEILSRFQDWSASASRKEAKRERKRKIKKNVIHSTIIAGICSQRILETYIYLLRCNFNTEFISRLAILFPWWIDSKWKITSS